MSYLGQETAAAVEDLISALAAARDEITVAEESLRSALSRVASGECTIDSFLTETTPAARRHALLESFEAVHQSRHKARRAFFTQAMARGYSASDMAQAWGISTQLADRYVKEAEPF